MNSSNLLKFKIEGMTCASCAGVIEKESMLLQGIESVSVNFATETAEFQTEKNFEVESLHALMQKLGYRALDPNLRLQQNNLIFNADFYRAAIAIFFASLTMFFAMVIPNNTAQAVFTSILVWGFARPYVRAVFNFQSNMNTLIGLGVLSSYFYSFYLILSSPLAHPYFEGGAFIIAFTLVGHYLDGLAKTKARNNLSSLYKMQIKFASKIIDGKEINSPVIDLKISDLIRLRPGEKFPLDGEIIEGETHADESMLTGESQAIAKSIGSQVFAGSLNLEGSVSVKITSTLHDTLVSGIVQFVEKAQLKKAPIQLYADKVVKIFVPIILSIALLTFIAWYFFTQNFSLSITHMITVLVIACPCALGLAVPMAIMLSTSEAAKNGLLISGGDVIQKGSHIDTIVFDKTGTLTEGRPELTEIYSFRQGDSLDFLKVAASSLQYSAHPLSQAIVNFATKKNLTLMEPDKFKSITGMGVLAEINQEKIILGNAAFLKQENIEEIIPDDFYKKHLGSYVFMAKNKKLLAAFIIADPIKKDASKLIKNLRALNINVWMLTGDHTGIAYKIGAELGISPQFIRAEVKPSEKADFILELQEKKFNVAMIGDGINDAPALARANLSIAMSNGSDVALEASEVSLLDGNILLVAEFFYRSQRTMKIIKENLILSSLYNLLCIPLAAGVFYYWYKISLTPMWASLAMSLSSFSVILNSFRARQTAVQ